MALSPRARRTARYAVPLGAAAATAIAVLLPSSASGADHPVLPAKTAAELLATIEQATLPDFTGTTVETARLGLPSLPEGALSGVATSGQGQLQQLMTLLTGSHTAHLAYAGPDRQRIAIFLDDLSEADVVHNGQDVWTYSSQGNAVTHTVLADKPDPGAGTATDASGGAESALDPTTAAEQALAKIDPSTSVTVDPTARVADRSAYQLVLAPKDARSLVGSVRIAIDSATSMPLRVQVWSRGNDGSPAFEVAFTSLTLRTPSASTFAFSTPPGATVGPGPLSQPSDTAPGAPDTPDSAPSAPTSTGTGTATTTLGKDWLTVVTGSLQDLKASTDTPSAASSAAPSEAGKQQASGASSVGSVLDQMATPVAGGKLIRTALVSLLITDDGHFYLGAVDPAYLEALAAQAAA